MSVAGFVAEVYGRCGDGSWSCGSGFAVGGRLVLTAGHVVVESGRPMTPVRVRLLGAANFVAAEVCWSGLGVGVDVALLRVTEADWAAPARRRPVRWGRLVGTAPGVPCTAVGFPAVQAAPDGVRDSEQAAGRINPLAMAKTGLHAITVDGPPHRVVASGSPWKGMSGAAVFCQDLLTAVVVQDPAGFASHRLVAVPIAAFADDAGFAEVLQSEIGADVMLEPVEVAGLFAEPPEVVSPASLLRADVAAVRFRGRVELLEELADWCQRPEWFLVRLVVGPGGQGKTRLGDELVQRMRRQGWVAGRVIDGAPASAQAALSGLACDVLLVVDYAETRAGQVQTLVERLRAANVRSRLVLLARSAGEWVGELTSRSADLAAVDAATVDDLPPVETSAAGRVEAWREAVDDLAAGLGSVTGYTGVSWPRVAAQVRERPPARLNADRDPTVLAAHMTALAALLQAGTSTAAAGDVEGVLLRHEQKYWTGTATIRGLRFDPAVYRRAVTAATVFSAADDDEASTVVAHLPGLRDQPEDRRIATEGWLKDLYPSQGRYWGSLQPDRLGEHLAGVVLAETPDLLAEPARLASAGQMYHALTVLARATVHQPDVAQAIAGLVHANPKIAVPAALAVATETEEPTPLVAAVAAEIERTDPEQVDLLELAHNALPRRSQVLADLAEHITRKLVAANRRLAAERPEVFLSGLAMSLNNLSIRLGDLGRREDGLAAIEEAVGIRRQLADERPEAFLPELGQSLNNLAVDLGALGRREEGLTAIEEAVEVHRRLADERPDAFLPDLALSLNNLSIRLGDLGRREAGLAAIEEAVRIRRRLADERPEMFLSDLSQSLNNLAIRLGALGRREDALAAIEEAVHIRRRLAAERPDAFLPDLAQSLNNLASRLAELGRREDGLAAIEEAVHIRRRLAAERPDAYLPDLAHSLNNLSSRLAELGRREDALAAVEEAVEVYRRLATERPDAYLPALAHSLNNLSGRLAELGRREDGLAAVEEAVEVYRGLATERPEVFLPDLAQSLNNLSVRLGALGRQEDGLVAVEEAVEVYRRLVAERPEVFLPDLASSLNNLSIWLGALGRREDGLAAIEEAVSIRRRLATERPEVFLSALAQSLNNLSIWLGALGRREDALAAVEEAVEVNRRLAAERPNVFHPALAQSLNTLAIALGELGRRDDGLAAVDEAVKLYRRLATERPEVFLPDLASSLINLSVRLDELGRSVEADEARDEAQSIRVRID